MMEEEVEIWKDIEGYPNYQVSNLSRVKSLARMWCRKERILKGSLNTAGYVTIQLYAKAGSKRKSILLHRLVMMVFQPNPVMEELEVNHKDLDITNNKISNLEWVTGEGNIGHYIASDKFKTVNSERPQGEECLASKLTESDVIEIRRLWTSGECNNKMELGRRFNIHASNVKCIVDNKTWKHLLPA